MGISKDDVTDEVISSELQKRLSPDALAKASQTNRDESAHPTKCQGVSGEVQPRKSVDKGIDVSHSNQEDSSFSNVAEEDSENVHQKKGPECEGGASESSRVSEDALYKLRPRQSPDTSVQDLLSEQGVTPFIKEPEKPSEDGYNWRKYGQKLVKGNEFTRSYYKCTHLNCLVKKQVERSHDGHITNIHYISKHEHPKPLNSPQISPEFVMPSQMRRPDIPTGTPRQAEGEESIGLGQTCQSVEPSESPLSAAVVSAGGSAQDTVQKPQDNNGGPFSKRRKKEVPKSDDMNPAMKSHNEPRHIVQTRSEADIVDDGYRWRKYGQKFVKGNPNPRSYYRCSSAGCPAKKHVERASHDPILVITAYDGKHDHDIPPSRTVMQNSARADSNTTGISEESTSESGENKHVGIDRVVHIGAN